MVERPSYYPMEQAVSGLVCIFNRDTFHKTLRKIDTQGSRAQIELVGLQYEVFQSALYKGLDALSREYWYIDHRLKGEPERRDKLEEIYGSYLTSESSVTARFNKIRSMQGGEDLTIDNVFKIIDSTIHTVLRKLEEEREQEMRSQGGTTHSLYPPSAFEIPPFAREQKIVTGREITEHHSSD